MAVPQNVDLLFVDGDPDGAVKADLITGSAVVYRIAAPVSATLKADPLLDQPGLYLLINTNKRTAYIGKADKKVGGKGVLKRMQEKHSAEIDAWDLAFAFIHSKPSFLKPTETSYLERTFYDAAVNVTEYSLLNGNTPSGATPNKGVKQACDMFAKECLFLLEKCLCCDVFVARKGTKAPASPSSFAGMHVYLSHPKTGAKAHGVLGNDAKTVLVKKGSTVSTTNNLPNTKVPKGLVKLRADLVSNGTIVNRVFTKDYVFNSPSQAAAVILGCAARGPILWKDKNGNTLKVLGY